MGFCFPFFFFALIGDGNSVLGIGRHPSINLQFPKQECLAIQDNHQQEFCGGRGRDPIWSISIVRSLDTISIGSFCPAVHAVEGGWLLWRVRSTRTLFCRAFVQLTCTQIPLIMLVGTSKQYTYIRLIELLFVHWYIM